MKNLFCILFPILLVLLSIQSFKVKAQTNAFTDSLIKLTQNAPDDTSKVQNFILIGQLMEGTDLEKARKFYFKAKRLSEKLNYHRGVLQFYSNYTFLLNITGVYDSSLYYNLKAVHYAQQYNDELYLGKSLVNTGTSYRNLGDFVKAIEYYQKGLKIFEKREDKVIEAQINSFLGALYNDISRYDTAVYYSQKAIIIAEKFGYLQIQAEAYGNLGNSLVKLNQFDKAEYHFKKSLELATELNHIQLLAALYLNIGNLYLQQEKFEEQYTYMLQALELAKELNLQENQVIALKGLGIYHLYTKSFDEAEKYALQALEIAEANQYLVEIAYIYNLLADISYAKNDIQQALKYDKLAEESNDLFMSDIIQNSISDAREKYETAKKDHEILTKNLTLDKRNNTIVWLGVSTFALIIFVIFIINNYRQKRRIHAQELKQLETEKQLSAIEMLIEGEEKERKRLAKDLHDGLGGMLSGIKFSVNNLKDKIETNQAQDFDRCIGIVDDSIKEMRHIAHSLMPEVLEKFGLDTALKNFCTEINSDSKESIVYQSFGLKDIKINHQTSLTAYRVVQELINNAIKHAEAKNIMIQITVVDNLLNITVEDDGKGIDISELHQKKGIGISNIDNRVKLINGTLDIQSEPEQGSSFYIELNLK